MITATRKTNHAAGFSAPDESIEPAMIDRRSSPNAAAPGSNVTADPVEACPAFVAAISIIGRRWSGLVIQAMAKGCSTFGGISRFSDGLNDASLSRRLKELEAEGLVTRSVDDGHPPKVRYALTQAGSALAPLLDELTAWGEDYIRKGTVTPLAQNGTAR